MLYPEISKLMETEGINSRYSLVIAAAKRARQLASESKQDKTVSQAIDEIAEGKIVCTHTNNQAPSEEN